MEKQDSHKNRALDNGDKTLDCIENLRKAIRILEKIASTEIKMEPMKSPNPKHRLKRKEFFP